MRLPICHLINIMILLQRPHMIRRRRKGALPLIRIPAAQRRPPRTLVLHLLHINFNKPSEIPWLSTLGMTRKWNKLKLLYQLLNLQYPNNALLIPNNKIYIILKDLIAARQHTCRFLKSMHVTPTHETLERRVKL